MHTYTLLIIYTHVIYILYTIQEIGVSDSSLTSDYSNNYTNIKINFTQFIIIRYRYSIIISTLFGGVRLQGQLYLYNNILTKDILPISLPNWLGETVCLTYLCSINRLIVTHKIHDDYSYLSLLLSGQESGQVLYSGCSMISNTIYTPTLTTSPSSTNTHESYHTTVATPISPPAADVSSNDIIIQILCDSTNNKMYTLSSNGNLSITDLSPTIQQVYVCCIYLLNMLYTMHGGIYMYMLTFISYLYNILYISYLHILYNMPYIYICIGALHPSCDLGRGNSYT